VTEDGISEAILTDETDNIACGVVAQTENTKGRVGYKVGGKVSGELICFDNLLATSDIPKITTWKNQPLSEKIVLTDYMVPMPLSDKYEFYYQDEPIYTSANLEDDIQLRMEESRRAGFDGWTYFLPLSSPESYIAKMGEYIGHAKSLKTKTGKDFYIVPQLNFTEDWDISVDNVSNAIIGILSLYSDDLPLLDGKPLISTFGGDYLSPMQWDAVRKKVKKSTASKKDFYLKLEMGKIKRDRFNEKVFNRYLDIADCVYLYSSFDDPQNSKIEAMIAARNQRDDNREISATAKNMYWRTETGTVIDGRGADLFVKSWEYIIDKGFNIAHVTTWNDYSETAIEPSYNRSDVISKLNLNYSNILKTGDYIAPSEEIYFVQPSEIYKNSAIEVEVIGLKRNTPDRHFVFKLEDANGNTLYETDLMPFPKNERKIIRIEIPPLCFVGQEWVYPILYDEDNLTVKYGEFINVNNITRKNYNYIYRNINEMLSKDEIISIVPDIQSNLIDDINRFNIDVSGISDILNIDIYRGFDYMGNNDIQQRDYRVYSHGEVFSVPNDKMRAKIAVEFQGGGITWNGRINFDATPTIVNVDGALQGTEKIVNNNTYISYNCATPFLRASSANKGVDVLYMDIIYPPAENITIHFLDSNLSDITFTLNELLDGSIRKSETNNNDSVVTISLTDREIAAKQALAPSDAFSFAWRLEKADNVKSCYYYVGVKTIENRFIKSKPIYLHQSVGNEPIASFDFEEAADEYGPLYKDLSGNNQRMIGGGGFIHRLLYNNPESSPQRVGGKLEFDGIDDFAVLTDSAIPIGVNTVSFRLTLHSIKEQKILKIRNGGYNLEMLADGAIKVGRRIGNNFNEFITKNKLVANNEYQIALTHSETLLSLYVNNELWGQTVAIGLANNGPAFIGSNESGTQNMHGVIDDFKIYNKHYTEIN